MNVVLIVKVNKIHNISIRGFSYSLANDITVHESKYPKYAKKYLVATVFEISTIYGSLLPLFIHTFVLFFAKQNYSSYCEFFQTNFGHKLARGNLQVSFSNVWIFPCATIDMCLHMGNHQSSSHTNNHCYAIRVAQAFVAPKCILCHKEGTKKSKQMFTKVANNKSLKVFSDFNGQISTHICLY